MKTAKAITITVLSFFLILSSYSQNQAKLKGKKVTVHTIDNKYGSFQGNMGYSYSTGINGKLDLTIDSGKHTIEFMPWYGDYNEYKLLFTAEAGKAYEIIKSKSSDMPQIIDSNTHQLVKDALITEEKHVLLDKNDKEIHLFKDKMEKNNLAILVLDPEYFDIIPLVYKIDDIWGPINAGCMRRYNNFKMGGKDLRGAMNSMFFTIELLPGEHTLEYSLHSNKVSFSINGLSTGSDSYEIYKLKCNFEADKSYTFKFLDKSDPTSLVITEK